jgi:hypothetical protein
MRSIIFLFLTGSVFLFSCIRHGCTDNEALNYDSKAKKTDYTCLFESSGIIHWSESSQNFLLTQEVTHLTVILDHDTLLKKADINSFGPFDELDCNHDNWFKFDRITYDDDFDIGMMLLDQNSDTLYAEKVTLIPGCNVYEIVIN